MLPPTIPVWFLRKFGLASPRLGVLPLICPPPERIDTAL
jgi:hypothetical protein